MSAYPSIESLCCAALAAALLGCQPEGAAAVDTSSNGAGRVIVSWSIDGAPLTAERCKAARIDYMEVEIRDLRGGERVGWTEVACALDRYPLRGTPTGRVQARVGAFGREQRDQPCMRYYGEAMTEATTADPAQPAGVALSAVSSACNR